MKGDAHTKRLARAVETASHRTPTAVLDAFVPKEELCVDVQSLLRLERLGSPFVCGGSVKLADILVAYGVLTDWPAVVKAWRRDSLEEWVEAFAAGLPANSLEKITAAVSAGIAAAFAPTSGASSDDEKKTLRDADGGSNS